VRRLGVMASAAREMGTKLIHLCTGTRDRINMWRRNPNNGTPEAWRDMVGCVKDAVEAAKGTGVTLAFEPEVNNIVDSAAKARKLLDEVGSAQLKVTMDGSNLFHAGEFARMGEILDEAFELVGKDVVMAHAKDVSHDGDAGHEAAGHGKLDYPRYVRNYEAEPSSADVDGVKIAPMGNELAAWAAQTSLFEEGLGHEDSRFGSGEEQECLFGLRHR